MTAVFGALRPRVTWFCLLAMLIWQVTLHGAPPVDYVVSHFAGAPVDGCAIAGTARQAWMQPSALAIAPDGTIYFLDRTLNLLRKLASNGQVSTVAGVPREHWNVPSWSTPPFDLAERQGLAWHPAGHLIVSGRSHLLRVTTAGVWIELPQASAIAMSGLIAASPDGVVYVAEYDVIYRVQYNGERVRVAGRAGDARTVDGPALDARFERINSLVVDAVGQLYVTDGYYLPASRHMRETWAGNTVRRISKDGRVTTLAGTAGTHGFLDGDGPDARFAGPTGIAVMPDASALFVADAGNDAIRKVTMTGHVTTVASGIRAGALAWHPDRFLVATVGNTLVRVSSDGTTTVLAGALVLPGYVDGPIAGARFTNPVDIGRDSGGRLFVADAGNRTLRRIDPSGEVVTVAGSPDAPSVSRDGQGTAARLQPIHIAVDATGTVYVGEDTAVRRVSPSGEVTTIAGAIDTCGSRDGTGTDARFCGIRGVALDPDGSIVVADATNHALRRIAVDGAVSTVTGGGGLWDLRDGPRGTATLSGPGELVVAADGTIFFADYYTVRAASRDGTVTTIAGRASEPGLVDGVGGAARFYGPRHLAMTPDGNILVTDAETLRLITPGGVVTTLAGREWVQGCEDGLAATARFNSVGGLAVTGDGTVYLADSGNHAIRRAIPTLLPPPSVTVVHPPSGSVQAGTWLTIAGANFTTRGLSVQICGIGATIHAVADASTMVVLVPAGVAAGASCPVVVTSPGGSSNADVLFRHAAPSLVAFEANGDGTGRLASLEDFAGAVSCDISVGVARPGAACDVSVDAGRRLVVVAEPAAGSVFTGWSGACAEQGQRCEFGASTETTVTATFVAATGVLHLAEGHQGDLFDTTLTIANPFNAWVSASLRFETESGPTTSTWLTLAPNARREIGRGDARVPVAGAFGASLDSTRPLVLERRMTWDARRYGAHSGSGVAASDTWYFAEGATHSGFQVYYLLVNPGAVDADVEITWLLPPPATRVVTHRRVAAGSRETVWVNGEDARLASTDVSGIVRVTNGVPIVAERAMYLSTGGLLFGAGHAAAGVTAPEAEWFLAEGATGPFFDCFILLANPSDRAALVDVEFWLPDGHAVRASYRVEPWSRFTVWVDQEDPQLEDTSFWARLSTSNGVPIVVERAMWWPGPTASTWAEAHVSPGTTAAGTSWTTADAGQDTRIGEEAYILVANTSNRGGRVMVTPMTENSPLFGYVYSIQPHQRLTIPVAPMTYSVDQRFPIAVSSLPIKGRPIDEAPDLVVERSTYWDARGADGTLQRWAAGTNVPATRVAR